MDIYADKREQELYHLLSYCAENRLDEAYKEIHDLIEKLYDWED